MKIKVASLQLNITAEQSKEERITLALQEIDRARDADLIVLPELWSVNFLDFASYEKESEEITGETVSRLASKAVEINSYIHAGSIIEEEGEKLYNTSILLNNEGEIISTYRKIHLFGYRSQEARILKPGQNVSTVTTPLGKIGLATCYDLRFPELFRKLLDEGAEIVLVTAAWPFPRVRHWQILNQSRALENLFYLVSANCAGSFQEQIYAGNSMVVDPWGTIISGSDYHAGIVRAQIDLEKLRHIRDDFPVLQDRKF